MPKPPDKSPDMEIIRAFEAAGVVEYLEYIQSGKRVMMTNFKAGVAKGLGLTLGMTVILALAAWVLTMLVDLPVIGEYAAQAEQFMEDYRESTNYNDEFEELIDLTRKMVEDAPQPASQGIESGS